jgi:hypothetical protein
MRNKEKEREYILSIKKFDKDKARQRILEIQVLEGFSLQMLCLQMDVAWLTLKNILNPISKMDWSYKTKDKVKRFIDRYKDME